MSSNFNSAKVYKALEKDKRFKNKLEVFLYFRLWGVNDTYKPFIGNAYSIKRFFRLKQPINEIKKELNYMYKCGLIYVYKPTTDEDRERLNIKNGKFIVGAKHIGDRCGDFYWMTPEDTVQNEETSNRFILTDPLGFLDTNCKVCRLYGRCSNGVDCISVLKETVKKYEDLLFGDAWC